MPAVITFWQLPEEELALLTAFGKLGPLIAYPAMWVSDPMLLAPESAESLIERIGLEELQLAPKDLGIPARIEQRHSAERILYGVSEINSCVIGYRRGVLRNGELSLSNLSAYWDYPDADLSHMIQKPADFVRWGKRILRIAKDHTPEWNRFKGYRLTQRAKESFDRGFVGLVDY